MPSRMSSSAGSKAERKKRGAGVVAAAEHHDLLGAAEVGRGGKKQRPVRGVPALAHLLRLRQQRERLRDGGLDVAPDVGEVGFHQAAHDQGAVLLVDGGGATGIKPVGEDFEILDGDGGGGHGVRDRWRAGPPSPALGRRSDLKEGFGDPAPHRHQRTTRAPPPPMVFSTSLRVAIEVSPGVVEASAPWAAP
jgi:hypothetical protein